MKEEKITLRQAAMLLIDAKPTDNTLLRELDKIANNSGDDESTRIYKIINNVSSTLEINALCFVLKY